MSGLVDRRDFGLAIFAGTDTKCFLNEKGYRDAAFLFEKQAFLNKKLCLSKIECEIKKEI
jgi:hypothetical protein